MFAVFCISKPRMHFTSEAGAFHKIQFTL